MLALSLFSHTLNKRILRLSWRRRIATQWKRCSHCATSLWWLKCARSPLPSHTHNTQHAHTYTHTHTHVHRHTGSHATPTEVTQTQYTAHKPCSQKHSTHSAVRTVSPHLTPKHAHAHTHTHTTQGNTMQRNARIQHTQICAHCRHTVRRRSKSPHSGPYKHGIITMSGTQHIHSHSHADA